MRAFVFTILTATAVAMGPGTAAVAGKPNVTVVLTDDQGYGDLSCHGNPVLKTPNLDKLHSQSIRFTDFHVTTQTAIWKGEKANGEGGLHVETAGTYRFALRRYPKEAGFPMAGSYPETQREFRRFAKYRALPVAQARLKIGTSDLTIVVKPTDTSANFNLELPAGDVAMKTGLLDAWGEALGGAYYVDVEHL